MKNTKWVLLVAAMSAACVLTAAHAQAKPKKIGYVVNYATHEWYQNVIKGMKDRGKELGIEIEVKDANLDAAKQIAAAEDFISQKVDVLVLTPVNEDAVAPLLRRAKEENVPVVLEGNPVKGMTALVAICDYDTGYHAGVEVGKIVKAKMGGKANVMNVGLPLLSATVLRSVGFMDGIKTVVPGATMVHDLDGGGNPDRALEVSAAALAQNSNINVIYGINDSSALGGLQAWKAAGKSDANLLVAGTGSEGLAFINAFKQEPSYRVEAAMFPEKIGFTLVDTAVKLYKKEKMPVWTVSPTAAMTGNDWQKYYTVEGTTRTINWSAVNALKAPDKCMKTSADLKK